MSIQKLAIAVVICGFCLSANAKTEVSSGSYYGGAVVGTLVGYGIGHAIQGRYGEMGWIFTVGELGGTALAAGGGVWMAKSLVGVSFANAKFSDFSMGGVGLMIAGSLLVTGFRIWEIIDVWAGAEPVSGEPRSAEFYLNKDEKRFAGARQLGVSPFNINFVSFNF